MHNAARKTDRSVREVEDPRETGRAEGEGSVQK